MVELVDTLDLGAVTLVKVFYMKDTLFVTSLKHHQELIDHILKYKEPDGICRVCQVQLMLDTGRGWTWIDKAIKRINTEEICVQRKGTSAYIVIHESLLEAGVFSRILHMLMDTYETPKILQMKDAELMVKYECKLKTIQMYRSYALTGWKTDTQCW